LDPDACEQRVKMLSHFKGSKITAVPCDLKDEEATRSAIRQAVNEMGRLDILVHCAAYVGDTKVAGWAVPFDQQVVPAWEDAMKVNLTSAFVMVQEATKALEASGHGSVVLFGSTYGLVGPDTRLYTGTTMGNPAGYAASKGGVLQLTRYMATVLAPNIRVNSITPGGVSRGYAAEFTQRYIDRTPMGRMATEEDLKGAVAYLCSDLSSYVTGHNLVVDGGWTAW
jgi:NAD(P)-dependent dehydrogenase (short-subunit alcohol dehydrogenase family)